MKIQSLFSLVLSLLFIMPLFGTPVNALPKVKSDKIITFKGQAFSPEEFKNLTPKEFKKKTGKKLSFKDRMILNILKKRTTSEGGFKMNWGAFTLGLLLGIIGIAITLFFKEKEAWKSALVGLAALIIILLIL